MATDQMKRMLNQSLFSKLWIGSDGRVTAEFAEPFRTIIEPVKDILAEYNKEKTRGTEMLTDFFSRLSNHIQKFFADGWNNDFLARPKGLEPPTFRTGI